MSPLSHLGDSGAGHAQWRVRFQMWPHGEPSPRWVERITASEEDARDQYEGLLSMLAPHGLRPCDNHVWEPTLERRGAAIRVCNVFVCPGCGWMDGATSHCCGQPQCRVPDPSRGPTATIALRCESTPFVAVVDLPPEVSDGLLDSAWEAVNAR